MGVPKVGKATPIHLAAHYWSKSSCWVMVFNDTDFTFHMQVAQFYHLVELLYGWHGSQYVCHAAEVCTGRFCLCLLENIPDIWDVSALLSAVDVTHV